MTLILGIDPGLSGALAYYDPALEMVADVFDMPVHKIKGKDHLDLYLLSQIVDSRSASTKAAFIEQVSAMPKQGVSSTFRFGFAAGVVNGVVAANMVPIVNVTPTVWKRAMGLTNDKDASRRLASHMFPRQSKLWARVKDADRAEAVLLAVYGSRILERKAA